MTSIPIISVSDASLDRLETPLLVVPLAAESLQIAGELGSADAATNGALGRAISRRDFRGAKDELLILGGAERGIQRLMLVGLGSKPSDPVLAVRRAATLAGRQANKLGVGSL